MNATKLQTMISEAQALEMSLFTMQAENNTWKMQLSQTVQKCKEFSIVERAEYVNDSFIDLESSIQFLKWELVAYNYRLIDFQWMNESELEQVLILRNLLKQKIQLIATMARASVQEFNDYLRLCEKKGFISAPN